MPSRGIVVRSLLSTLAAVLVLGGCGDDETKRAPAEAKEEPGLDLSGLAWLGDDRALAVHDAKNPDENGRPRLSLLQLPASGKKLESSELEVDWPAPLGQSSDLESADRVPGTDRVLFAESGDDGGRFQRIFVAEHSGDGLRNLQAAGRPQRVDNVEGIAVARVAGKLFFLYAERAQDKPSTEIAWAPLSLDPLRIGSFRRVRYASPEPRAANRPVTALTIDSAGRIYAASAFDPDVDEGPFRSSVWRIGRIRAGSGERAEVVLTDPPERLGTLDGFKVESLMVRESDGRAVVFAGTDDEDYGAALRPLPGAE